MKSLITILVFIAMGFFYKSYAQTSILNEGVYFPMNGSYFTNYNVDDWCNSYNAQNGYQPCNRGARDEGGVENGAYLFSNSFSPYDLSPFPGNYFPQVYTPYENLSNGFTVAFSYKLTGNNANNGGGIVMDASYETGSSFDSRIPRGFKIAAGKTGVSFTCHFGNLENYEITRSVTSSGIGQLIPPFVPDTGVWYHVICVMSQDRTATPGWTNLRIYINNALKGENVSVYIPSMGARNFVSIGALTRPNNTTYNPCYRFGNNGQNCQTPTYDYTKPFGVLSNNPYLVSGLFNGALDEIRYYDKELDYDQRTEVYNARLNSPVPAIRSYSPTSVKAGANMTIIGKNFSDATSVQINGTIADSLTIISNDTIRAKVANPTNSTDSTIIVRSVRVINDDGNAVRYGTVSTSSNNTPAPPRPGIIITGPASACGLIFSDTVVTYRITDTLSSTYLWRVSTTNMIVLSALNTDSLRVKFKPGFNSGIISVRRMRPNDTSNISLVITNTIPARTSAITGNRNICNNVGTAAGTPARYSVRRAVGASEYVWTLPSGASIQGVSGGGSTYTTTDTAINLVFTSSFTTGTLMVRSQNACGSSADMSLALAPVNVPIPGAITGPADVCASMISDSLPAGNPVTYKVRRNAAYSGYAWTVPANVIIIDYPGGQGTNTDTSIIVLFDSTFVSGNISVRGVTPCFTTAPRNLSVTRRLPSLRPISILSSSLTCPTRSIQYQSLPIQFARWYEWSVPANGTIDGRRDTTQLTVNYSTAASLTGAVVRLRGLNNCGKGVWTAIPVRLPACTSSFARLPLNTYVSGFGFKATAFPNPSQSAFNLQWSTGSDLPLNIQVTDLTGKRMDQWQVGGSKTMTIGQSYQPGIYMVHLKQGAQTQTLRLIKQ